MKPKTLVKSYKHDKRGVVIHDDIGVPGNGVLVVLEGQVFGTKIPLAYLEDLGPENAVPDAKRCGIGQGANCCIFLLANSQGFHCGRFDPEVRTTLILQKPHMVAQREPMKMFPDCMLD